MHCHWLTHEDYGMMAWKYVTNDDTALAQCDYSAAATSSGFANGDISLQDEYATSGVNAENNVIAIVFGVVGAVLILAVIGAFVCCYRFRRDKVGGQVQAEIVMCDVLVNTKNDSGDEGEGEQATGVVPEEPDKDDEDETVVQQWEEETLRRFEGTQ